MTGLNGSITGNGSSIVAQFQGPALSLYNAAATIYSQVAAGNYTVYAPQGAHVVLGQQVNPQISCLDRGYTWIDYYCVPCESGYYEEDSLCTLCPVGTYNPDLGQSSCIDCPDGLTTYKTGSKHIFDCSVVLIEESGVLANALVGLAAGLTSGLSTVLSTLTLLIAIYRWKKNKKEMYALDSVMEEQKNSTAPINTVFVDPRSYENSAYVGLMGKTDTFLEPKSAKSKVQPKIHRPPSSPTKQTS